MVFLIIHTRNSTRKAKCENAPPRLPIQTDNLTTIEPYAHVMSNGKKIPFGKNAHQKTCKK